MDEKVVGDHLRGHNGFVAGIYPFLPDETCCFLAMDFDAAKHLGGKNIAVICPEHAGLETINQGVEGGIIRQAFLIGSRVHLRIELLLCQRYYQFIELDAEDKNYHTLAAIKGTELLRSRQCQVLMKGFINTVVFSKAVLNKETGITTDFQN